MLRVGRRVGRTIYFQLGDEPSDDDTLIGMMDTPELAKAVVNASNAVNFNIYGQSRTDKDRADRARARLFEQSGHRMSLTSARWLIEAYLDGIGPKGDTPDLRA